MDKSKNSCAPIISAQGIRKSFNGEAVLKGLSLNVSKGEFVSIMGESGSGKSTFLSILAGFLTPDKGHVRWNGKDISTYSDNELAKIRCSEVGFVFQAYKLISTLNAKDNMLFTTVIGKKLSKESYEYAMSLAKELGVDSILDKYPSELSGGQCQRVAIVRALAYKPSLVILDEPTGALDSVMEAKVMNLLKRINQEQKTTIIQVTHSERVAGYGEKTIILKDGEIEI